MDLIGKQYVTVSTGNQLGHVFHSQITCPSLRSTFSVELVDIIEFPEGLVAKYRGTTAEVTQCKRCPPPLRWDWQGDAACAQTWPAVDMIDMGQGRTAAPLIAEYCDHCPVVVECAAFALSCPEEMVGIWGGVLILSKQSRNGSDRARSIQALSDKYATLTKGDAA